MSNISSEKSIKISHIILANGLRVVVAENRKAPVICLNVAYKTGSKNEEPDKTGFAHLFEHLMFEGSKNIPKGSFDKYCSMAGGTNNAYTNFDMTSYYMTLPSNQLELGLWLESDRMADFAVTEEALKIQQNIVVEEIRQTVEEQPYGRWRELLSSEAYSPECSYSWEVHGKKEHVAAASYSDVKEFFDIFYRPNNACLVISGDVDKDKAFRLASKYFEGIIPSIKKPRSVEVRKKYLQSARKAEFKDSVPHPAVFLAYHLPGFIDDEINIAELISNIAGAGRSSRLYRSLVYQKQIASYAGAYVDQRELSSLLIFYAIANDESASANLLADALLTEIEKIAKGNIDEYEFVKAKNQLSTQFAQEIQYNSGIANLLAYQSLFWNNPERFYTLLDSFNKIKYEETARFAGDRLSSGKFIRIDALPGELNQ